MRQAFTSINGVQDLIAKIVNSIYVAAEYDEYLLFKYMLIKGVNNGSIKVLEAGQSDTENAIMFRGTSNKLEFISTQYNTARVHTNTKRADQYIFMSAEYNAQFDVEVLASAFNMDKADFMGKLKLIDDWTTFDSERFSVIMENSDGFEAVTAAELAVMENVVAVLIDKEWFQMYDNNNQFTETFISSGLYWNYFYHVWKTVSWSPFSNAVCFSALPVAPNTIDVTVASVDQNPAVGAVVTLKVPYDNARFIQTEELTQAGIAVTPNGAIIAPADVTVASAELVFVIGDNSYTATATLVQLLSTSTTITFTKE